MSELIAVRGELLLDPLSHRGLGGLVLTHAAPLVRRGYDPALPAIHQTVPCRRVCVQMGAGHRWPDEELERLVPALQTERIRFPHRQ